MILGGGGAEDSSFYGDYNHWLPLRTFSLELVSFPRKQPSYLPEGCEPAAYILRAGQWNGTGGPIWFADFHFVQFWSLCLMSQRSDPLWLNHLSSAGPGENGQFALRSKSVWLVLCAHFGLVLLLQNLQRYPVPTVFECFWHSLLWGLSAQSTDSRPAASIHIPRELLRM